MRILFFITSFITLCSSLVMAQMSQQEYINQYKNFAIKEMNRTGIPASITLSQGILESANGNSRLAQQANNHFGIKCHSNWKGKTIHKDDDKKNECFRKYKSAYDSFKDHSDFLTRGKRYSFLFEYKATDYKKWAKGLKKAGYATSKTYATRLIQIIEKNKLYQYDSKKGALVAQKRAAKTKQAKDKPKKQKKICQTKEDYAIQLGRVIKTNNGVKYIVAKNGDTYLKLIDEFQLLRFELYKYNDIEKGKKKKKGEKVYLQPKRNNAEKGKKYHLVKKGETCRFISQKYGIKLKKLLKRNHLSKNQTLKVGSKLQIGR